MITEDFPDEYLEPEYYNCDGCGETFHKEELHHVGRQYICDDCMRDAGIDE